MLRGVCVCVPDSRLTFEGGALNGSNGGGPGAHLRVARGVERRVRSSRELRGTELDQQRAAPRLALAARGVEELRERVPHLAPLPRRHLLLVHPPQPPTPPRLGA